MSNLVMAADGPAVVKLVYGRNTNFVFVKMPGACGPVIWKSCSPAPGLKNPPGTVMYLLFTSRWVFTLGMAMTRSDQVDIAKLVVLGTCETNVMITGDHHLDLWSQRRNWWSGKHKCIANVCTGNIV